MPIERRTWRRTAIVAMTVGGVVVIVGTLLPWVRTGGRRRHSYDVFAIVERLGFAPGGPAGIALRWWPVVPLLVTTAVVLAWWGRLRWGGGVGVAVALDAGVVALVVASRSSALVAVEAGALVTVVGAVVLLGGSFVALSSPSAPP